MTPPLNIAITGSHGFIGRHLAQAAKDAGHRVLGLDLKAPKMPYFDTVTEGSILDSDALDRAFNGADLIVHTAAIVEEGGDRATFFSLNVDGTRAVAQAARRAGAQRLIHLSSVMVYGFAFREGVDEADATLMNGNAYCDSKIASEDAVRAFDQDLDVIVARPGDVVGIGSIPWVERPLDLMRRRLFALPQQGQGRLNPILVQDVVRALLHLAHLKTPHPIYNITTGASVSCADFFDRLAYAAGLSRPPRAPSGLMRSAASLTSKIAPILNFKSPFQAEGVDFLLRTGTYSGKRLRESGYHCAPSLASLFEAVENLSR